MARLLSAYDRAVAGISASVIVVQGEAGVGKSRLVDDFCAIVRARGGRTLSGSAMEIDEANLPYVPILEALQPLVEEATAGDPAALEVVGRARHDLARLFPELGPSLAEAESQLGVAQTRLFGQVLGLLGRLGQRQPSVLVIEDLQWADRSTRELVSFLARTLHSAQIVLVVTVRTDALHARHPLTPMLVEIARGERVTRMTLERLSRADHDRQVAAILDMAPDPELLAQTYARSDGNPFYTEELVAPDAGSGVVLSTSLREVLLARVRGLRERTRAVLRLVAVGYSVTHPLLEVVARMPDDALLDSLREAVDRAVLTTDPTSGRYRFRHPLIAEAIYDDLLPGERLRLHRRFAEALEVDGSLGDGSPARAPAELANHWLRAGDERRAVPSLITAARAASAAFAQAEAFGHLDLALTIASQDPAALAGTGLSVAELTRMAAEAAEASGAFARAVELWERTIALHDATADPAGAGILEARVGEAYWLAGDRTAFERHRRAAVALVPAEPPSGERAWVLSRLASALLMGPAIDEARSLADEAVRVSRAVGARREEGRALGALGMARLLVGDAEGAVPCLREALAISSEIGQVGEEAIDRSNLSEALHEAGRLDEALAVVTEGIESVQAAGLQHTYGETMNAIAIDRAYLRGKWELAERLIAEGQARAPRGLPLAWLSLVVAEFEASRGRLEAAEAALATADRVSAAQRVTGLDRSPRAAQPGGAARRSTGGGARAMPRGPDGSRRGRHARRVGLVALAGDPGVARRRGPARRAGRARRRGGARRPRCDLARAGRALRRPPRRGAGGRDAFRAPRSRGPPAGRRGIPRCGTDRSGGVGGGRGSVGRARPRARRGDCPLAARRGAAAGRPLRRACRGRAAARGPRDRAPSRGGAGRRVGPGPGAARRARPRSRGAGPRRERGPGRAGGAAHPS